MADNIPFTVFQDGKLIYQSGPSKQGAKQNRLTSVKSKSVPSSRYKTFIGWKSVLFAGALVTGLVVNSIYKPFNSPRQMTEVELNSIPKQTLNEARSLASNSDFVSRKKLSLNDYLLHRTEELFDTMSYEQIIKTANLNGLFKDYSGLRVGEHVDFKKGFEFMWARKIALDKKNDGICEYESFADDLSDSYNLSWSKKSNLDDYSESLENKIKTYKSVFDFDSFFRKPNGKHIHPEKERLINNFVENLDSKIFISYAVTELFPNINPKLNLILYDHMLEEAGLDFVYFGTVASGDTLNSFGSSQLTPIVINPGAVGTLNKYLPEDLQIPISMTDIETPEQYDRASFFTAIYNIKNLSGRLFKKNTLTKFNNLFESLDEKDQSLLVAGILTAMNYRPADVSNGVANYVDESLAGRVSKNEIVNNLWVGDAQNYYDRSVKNYLTLSYADSD